MAVTLNSVVDPIGLRSYGLQYLTGSSVNFFSTAVAGGVNGSKVVSAYVVNSSTAAHGAAIFVFKAGVAVVEVSVTIPQGAGVTAGIPPVNLLAPSVWPGLPLDSDGNPFFFLGSTTDTMQFLYGGSSILSGQVAIAGNVLDF